MKYLIVDDDRAGLRLLAHFLAPYGQCDLAETGQQAIALCGAALDSGQPYDLVCLDILLPDLTGHAVLQALRQLEIEHGIYGSDGSKVLMITAMSDSKHCIQAFGEGCEGYITKPIRENRLLMEVQSLLGELRRQSETAPPAAAGDSRTPRESRRGRYLVVDDDAVCRALLRDILSLYGRCDFAHNGSEAAEAIRSALDEGRPYDLLCLDIMMPGTNGHEALEAIRRIEAEHSVFGTEGVKVIMTTSLRESKHCLKAFTEGCEAYVTKPVKQADLLRRMQELGVLPAAATARQSPQ